MIHEVTQERCYVIAEIGQNHGGSMDEARRLIDAAAWCGADAVKSQKRHMPSLFTDEELARPYESPHAYGATYGEHRAALELTIDQHADLAAYARSKGLDYSLSVWDAVSLKEAVDAGMPWIKVPSAAATAIPLLTRIANTQLPVLLSTGMCSAFEVNKAVQWLNTTPWLCVMHCTSAYPAAFEDLHLRVLSWWAREKVHDCDAYGFSGHHRGIAVDMVALAFGARVIERHFTLDRAAKGSDHAASLEPDGLRRLVRDIRAVERALGSERKRVLECEEGPRKKLRTKKLQGAA